MLLAQLSQDAEGDRTFFPRASNGVRTQAGKILLASSLPVLPPLRPGKLLPVLPGIERFGAFNAAGWLVLTGAPQSCRLKL